MGKLLFQGHGSIRMITEDGIVIYIDPSTGKGYEEPADLILVTHQHSDHNQIRLPKKKQDCVIIQNYEALKNGVYHHFDVKGISIQSVAAENKNHNRSECVGYMVKVEGKLFYFAGDTSYVPEMEGYAELGIDYAFLPVDGIFNMGVEEASRCARVIKAKHTTPIHQKPFALFEPQVAEQLEAEGRLIIEAGEEITF